MGNKQIGCLSAPAEHKLSSAARPTPYASGDSSHHVEHSILTVSSSSDTTLSGTPPPPSSCYAASTRSSSFNSITLKRACPYKRNVKLLFLDVDGVLNFRGMEWDAYNQGIDTRLLYYLKLIIEQTGCKVVLSTTWRLHPKARHILLHTIKTKLDLNTDDLIIGQTDDLKAQGKHRTDEIECWMKQRSGSLNVVSWCALDDLALHKYDMHALAVMDGHFVRTCARTGVTPHNVLSCIGILNGNDAVINSYCVQSATGHSSAGLF